MVTEPDPRHPLPGKDGKPSAEQVLGTVQARTPPHVLGYKSDQSGETNAFRGLASRPAVGSVIAGSKSPEQVQANAKAADWALTAAELTSVDRILAQHAGAVLR